MTDKTLRNFVKKLYRRYQYAKNNWYKYKLRGMTISKREFIEDLKRSLENKSGYAAGKLGPSQKYWMYYEIFLKKEFNIDKIKKYEEMLVYHGLKQCGIFPGNPKFYLDYNSFYMDHVKNTDCLGLFIDDNMYMINIEVELIKYYKLKNKFIYYPNQEPDRSFPNNDNNCYLQYLRDKKILIICPFAKFLEERAKKEIFEKVWANTGKKWFYPYSVDAIEFPYGFSHDTHKKYSTAIDLFNYITNKINEKDFDIALIGASGLAIPLASYVKNMGKVGIDLGGHLQIIFGVLGERWKIHIDFEKYFNEYWMEMPARYKPKRTEVGDYDYW